MNRKILHRAEQELREVQSFIHRTEEKLRNKEYLTDVAMEYNLELLMEAKQEEAMLEEQIENIVDYLTD